MLNEEGDNDDKITNLVLDWENEIDHEKNKQKNIETKSSYSISTTGRTRKSNFGSNHSPTGFKTHFGKKITQNKVSNILFEAAAASTTITITRIYRHDRQ